MNASQNNSYTLFLTSSSSLSQTTSRFSGASMDGQLNDSQPIGGLRPPPGVTPNFVDPYSTRAYFILTFVMCVTVTSIFILVRAYTKMYIIKSHQWEDCEKFPWSMRTRPKMLSLLLTIHVRHFLCGMGKHFTFKPHRCSSCSHSTKLNH